jgi:L-amino acid N-acyltransferase YncA
VIARRAGAADAAAIARIYNQGIDDRIATFETRPRTETEVAAWLAFPVAVAEEAGQIVAFASTSAYNQRACYAHIADFSVYTARETRRCGAGRCALQELLKLAKVAGLLKLTSKVLVENTASRKLLASLGFHEIGIHRKHGQLDGTWHDVVIVEFLL